MDNVTCVAIIVSFDQLIICLILISDANIRAILFVAKFYDKKMIVINIV